MENTEISRVLMELDLQQYQEVLARNQINDVTMDSIEKEDLIALIPVVGHRAVIWNALKKLKSKTIYVCFICSQGFVTLRDLVIHLTTEHKLSGSSEYTCTLCQGLYNRKAYLQHMRKAFQIHNLLDNVVCRESQLQAAVELDFDSICDNLEVNDTHTQPTEASYDIDFIEIEKNVLKLMCTILRSGKVPISTADSIISGVKTLMRDILTKIQNFVCDVISQPTTITKKLFEVQTLTRLQSIFLKFETRHKLDKYLLEHKLVVMPKQVVLDTDIAFATSRGKGQVQSYKAVAMQYIPITNTILQLLSMPNFLQILEMNKSFNGECYSNFREGKFFHRSMFPKNTIFINIYYDDAEIANPLGSKSGKHKLANFYLSILDLPQHMLSSPENIFLLASLKTVDLKASSVNAVIQIIVKELKVLWEEGVSFQHNGVQLNFKVALAQVSGDNLGLHTLLGFSEGFNANFPCRRCKLHRNDCKTYTYECGKKLRNVQNYSEDIRSNSFPTTGINFDSVLNELPYLHVTNIYVFDVMHDILEGIAPDLIHLCLKDFIKKKYFMIDKVNFRLESFNYGRGYRTTKPSQIKLSFLKGDCKIGQNASQTLCLLLYIPLLIGDLIPEHDEVWHVLILLREILQILLADRLTHGGIIYLDSIISEFLTLYQSIFQKSLKPKHHHLTHYASSIEEIGPLRHFWSMTFEAKHKFFKTAAHAACNFKNVAKTLAYRHQLSLCFRLHGIDEFMPVTIEYEERLSNKIDDNGHQKLLVERYGIQVNNSLKFASRINLNGCDFEIGCFVVLRDCSTHPVFGMESQSKDDVSIFDGSIISQREIEDRGLALDSSFLRRLKNANTKATPTQTNSHSIGVPNLVLNSSLQTGERGSLEGVIQQSPVVSSPGDFHPLHEEHVDGQFINYTFQTGYRAAESPPLSNQQSQSPTAPTFRTPIFQTPADLSRTEGTPTLFAPEAEVSKNIYGFEVESVLLQNDSTRIIIQHKLEQKRFILRTDRQTIAAVLIDMVIEKLGTSPSKNALEQLARHLTSKYPILGDPRRQEYGWQMWFFHTINGHGATGFLEDRLKNQRKKLARKAPKIVPKVADEGDLDWDSEYDDENPPPDESKLAYLKHNFGAEVQTTMKETVFMRRSMLRLYVTEQFVGLQKAMQAMPRLFDTENMITQDFNIRHPRVSLILYERWPKVSKLLLDYAEESGICYKKKLEVVKNRYDLNDVDVGLIAFCLLPFILPSCGRRANDIQIDEDNEEGPIQGTSFGKRTKQKSGTRKRQATVKASDLDSLRSMIMFRSKNTHVAEVLSENQKCAPFILGLGSSSNLEFENYFVVISKVAIPCGPNFFVALDTCFKCFTVLYLPPPVESFDHWLFIQHGVCGRPLKDVELPPVVQALTGQIMSRI